MVERIRTYGPLTLFFAIALVGMVILVNTRVLPADDKYVVFAKLKDAGGVLKNYSVKVNNVTAGSVEKISLDENDDVVVRMELDEGVGPIGPDATADVRPVNLLGEKYVDLDVGDKTRGLPSQSTIPKERTGVPTEIDDVLNMLDPDTRTAMRIIINEAGLAIAGRGADFNQTLADLPPALDEAQAFVADVERDNAALRGAITAGDRVVAEMSAKRDDLGALVESAGRTFESVAERREDLGRTLRSAPGGLRALSTTLGELTPTAEQLIPAAQDLRAASPSLARALSNADGFADAARPALATATDVAPDLARLGRQSLPTIKRLRPTARRMARFAGDAGPILTSLDRDKGLRELIDFMHGWSDVISNQDGLGHVFRLRFTFDPKLLQTAVDRYTQQYGLTPTRRRSTKRTTPPADVAPPPAATPAPAAAGAPVRDQVNDLLDKLKKPGADVQNLVNQVKDTVDGQLGRPVQKLLDDTVEETKQGSPLLNYLLGP